jgi:hypothetical protein
VVIRDGDWRLFDYDFQSGRTVWMLDDGNKIVFRTDYPIEATLTANSAMRNEAGNAWKGDWHHIASVPLNLAFDDSLGLLKAHDQGDDKYLSRWLNDSDNRGWRTKEGSV